MPLHRKALEVVQLQRGRQPDQLPRLEPRPPSPSGAGRRSNHSAVKRPKPSVVCSITSVEGTVGKNHRAVERAWEKLSFVARRTQTESSSMLRRSLVSPRARSNG